MYLLIISGVRSLLYEGELMKTSHLYRRFKSYARFKNDTMTDYEARLDNLFLEARLDNLFLEAFPTNHSAMHDWAMIKMELKRLRNETQRVRDTKKVTR